MSTRSVRLGRKGERNLVRKLKSVPGEKYILKNLYIPVFGGMTAEIDVLMITRSGLYCFEMKNYNARVTGNVYDVEWTAHYSNGRGYSVPNAVLQNRYHVRALEELFASAISIPVHSFVVFGNSASFRISGYSYDSEIVSLSSLPSQVKKRISATPDILSSSEIGQIYSVLKEYSNASSAEKNLHNSSITNLHVENAYTNGTRSSFGHITRFVFKAVLAVLSVILGIVRIFLICFSVVWLVSQIVYTFEKRRYRFYN